MCIRPFVIKPPKSSAVVRIRIRYIWKDPDPLYDFMKWIRKQGCILKFEIDFLPPPPFLIYIFSPNVIYYIEGLCAAGEKFSAFFVNFINFKSIGETIYIFPPFFIPFQSFFPPNIWPYWGKTEKYTPLCPETDP